MNLLQMDRYRYKNENIPVFLIYMRKCQKSYGIKKIIFHCLYRIAESYRHVEISHKTCIGGGLYIGHAYAITINMDAVLGENINIHKGVTIGQENRGRRRGVPHIGNRVWIGINAVIVGNITVGDDVLIAPNAYVNCDIPSHSIVLGNPCRIHRRDDATEKYIENIAVSKYQE